MNKTNYISKALSLSSFTKRFTGEEVMNSPREIMYTNKHWAESLQHHTNKGLCKGLTSRWVLIWGEVTQ